ncbi:MAG: hypothetical protein H0U63_05920 [Burkholderiales bacterium]|nr:hypothetical protein [Burkholderiales bacterium]
MKQAIGWLAKTLIVFGCIGYQWLVHSAVVKGQGEAVRLTLIVLPLLFFAYWVATRSDRKRLWFSVLLLSAGSTYLLSQQSRLGLAAAYGIPHGVIYLSLLWFFGRTLIKGREPLISRLARRVHGELPAALEAYTRRLTFAWCVFFAGQIITSALLFKFASLNTWSLFVNLLNFPLLVLMFVGEYLYRIIRHKNYPKASIMTTIRAFTDDGRAVKAPKGVF